MAKRNVGIESGTWRAARSGATRAETLGEGRNFAKYGVFFPGRINEPCSNQKCIRRDSQSCMMMKPAPSAPFVVTQTELLLEFLVVAFDAPAHFDRLNQFGHRDGLGQVRQPVLGGRGFCLGPF